LVFKNSKRVSGKTSKQQNFSTKKSIIMPSMSEKIKKIVVTSVIFLLGSLMLFSPTLSGFDPEPNRAHAQSSLSSAIGSGLAQGIGVCLGNVGSQLITTAIAGKAAGASFINPVPGIPAVDVGSQISQGQDSFSRLLREGCLDALAYTVAQETLDQLSNSTLSWVQSGFTQFGQTGGGENSFIGDIDGFLRNVGEQSFNRFLQDVTRDGGSFSEVCESFSGDVLETVARNYYEENDSPTGIEFDPDNLPSRGEIAASGCEIAGGDGSLQEFINGNFEEGGWQAFYKTVDNPNASPVGAYLEQNEQLRQRIEQARSTNLRELQNNEGWVSSISCPNSGGINNSTGKCQDGSEPVVQTPGSVVSDMVNETVGSGQRQLELADEVNEVVAALIDQLVSKITGDGTEGGTQTGVFADAAQEGTSRGDLEEYASGGTYEGIDTGNYASSTLAEQISLEQSLRSVVSSLPPTNDIARLEARLNQCLAGGTFDGPGSTNQTEQLLADLTAVEQAVFPPPEGTRETTDLQEVIDDAQENPNEPVNSGSEGNQVGPQKVNWVNNPQDWDPGTVYGNERCEEGEYKLPGPQQGVGNISFSYSQSDGQWQGFVCARDDFDSPTIGSDSAHVDLQSFDEFFPRAEPIDIAENIEDYYDPSGYNTDDRSQIKVDWTNGSDPGADFDWTYYNLFADSDQLLKLNSGIQEVYNDGKFRHRPQSYPGTGGDTNRYGARSCSEQTEGATSWIVKPGTEVWTQQECVAYNDSTRRTPEWIFEDTGTTRPAFREARQRSTSFAGYVDQINNLIGDQEFDENETGNDRFTAPTTEQDNIRELKHDLANVATEQNQEISIDERKQLLDERFRLIEQRFHTEEDLEVAQNAFEKLNPGNPDSLLSRVQDVVDANNCEVPDGWEPPVDDEPNEGSSDLISSFTASRSGSGGNFVSVGWDTSATQCQASSNPTISSWSGSVPTLGNRYFQRQSAVELTLTCETNSPQETDTDTVFIEQSTSNPTGPTPGPGGSGGGNRGGDYEPGGGFNGGSDRELEQFRQ
jgi:hypothetical protein